VRRLIDFFSSDSNKVDVSPEENYEHIILDIINEVVKNRKRIHNYYDNLIEKVWVSAKPLKKKTILAKYLLGRLLKESDRIFIKGQNLATRLCPKCNKFKKSKRVYYQYSDKTH